MIDDDTHLTGRVAHYFEQNGYSVMVSQDGQSGLSTLARHAIDLVILDPMLSDMDGLDFCRRLRALPAPLGQTGVLMLSAKCGTMDRIAGIEMGADDYQPKPFEPRELLARARAILRRNRDTLMLEKQTLRFGSLAIDCAARAVTVGTDTCKLTAHQFNLLVALAERPGHVLTRSQILKAVHGRELGEYARSIDVHMGRIRAAIETDPKIPRRIVTVRGMGYLFSRQQD